MFERTTGFSLSVRKAKPSLASVLAALRPFLNLHLVRQAL